MSLICWCDNLNLCSLFSRISEISMEVAEEGRITAGTPPAHLIERCDCPSGYSGLSCEVSWHLTCISSIYLTRQMEILPELSLLQSALLSCTLLSCSICSSTHSVRHSKKRMMLLLPRSRNHIWYEIFDKC